MRLFVTTLIVLTASAASDVNEEAEELLTFLFQYSKYFPRNTPLVRSEKYPEVGLTAEELIKHYGYPVENHEITTTDGYILSLQRIPHGIKNPPTAAPKPVVFLMHGLLASSTCFVFNGIENSLAFLLAEEGYDVWLGNARGSTYARKHVDFHPDDDKSKFWDFSWHEIGVYDLPASIDYVLQQTERENLVYVGHSQGTTNFFVMASELPEYNQKVSLAVSLAPVAFLPNIRNSASKKLAKSVKILELIANAIDFYEILPQLRIFGVLVEEYCGEGAETQEKCIEIYESIMGANEKQLNVTMIPVYLSHFPAGASVKQMYHYAQEINSGHFRKYDYGLIKNFVKYGSFTPPDYNLENIVTPVALYYSLNDDLTADVDVEVLAEKLPNVVDKHLMEDEFFSHTNFLTAIQAKELLYDRVIELIKKY